MLTVIALLVATVMYHDAAFHLAVKAGALLILVIGGYLRWASSSKLNRLKTRCGRCRYPRRGLPADTPCPECGTAFTEDEAT